ncbi:MAG: hypothetical protein GX045_07130 [Clostridiaceae bacterium]|jgi:hypothetical protein|nr:hypothetical protein [Clostridiaceae bacterium]
MSDINKNELSNIPLPTEKDRYNRSQNVSPYFSGGFPDIKRLFRQIKLDDVLLLGLIILIATDDDCDNFLLVLLVFIFLAGFDMHLFTSF